MINLSPQATAEIKRLQSKQGLSDVWFRLAVKSGGCSGLFYDMCFETSKGGDSQQSMLQDYSFDCNGIRVVIDTETLGYVNGLRLDYSQDLMGGGFRFDNPQALSSCGCGNSFSITSDSVVITCHS
jgi:iron-sulfur cluster assembly protein